MMTSRSQKGFTLLEVLVAIAIFAVISLASFSIFDTVIKSEETSSKRTDRLHEIQRAFILMERDFLQIARRTVRLEGESPLSGFIHTESNAFESSSGAIGFVRGGWTNPGLLLPRGDMQSVVYQVNEDTLERIHFNFVDASLNESPKKRLLLTDVNEITFEFYDGKSWTKEFSGEDLPNAIAVEIDTKDYGLIKRKFLVAATLKKSDK